MCSQKTFFPFYVELKRATDLSLSLASANRWVSLHTDGGNGLQRLVGAYLHLIGGLSVGNNAGNGNKTQITLEKKAFAYILCEDKQFLLKEEDGSGEIKTAKKKKKSWTFWVLYLFCKNNS